MPVFLHIKRLVPQAGVVERALLLITHHLIRLVQSLKNLGVSPLVGVVDETELTEGAADDGGFGVLGEREGGREGGRGGLGEDGRS